MKRFITSLAIACTVLCASSSCEDFLDVKLSGVIDGDYAMSHPEEMCIAAYSALGDDYWDCPLNLWPYGDVRSDDAYKGGMNESDNQGYHDMEVCTSLLSTTGNIDGMWYRLYCVISRVNQAIIAVQNADEATYPQKAARLAEMRFLRAHFYFKLKTVFRYVPYIDEVAHAEQTQEQVGNRDLTEEEFWNRITEDFEAAYNTLDMYPADKARVSKTAAAAYLAKVWLYRAFPQDENHQFTGTVDQQALRHVITYTDYVKSATEYRLEPDFSDNFLPENPNGCESIFAVQHSTKTADGTIYGRANWSNILNCPAVLFPGGHDFLKPSQNLVNAFKTRNGLPMFDDFNDSRWIPNPDPSVQNPEGRSPSLPHRGHARFPVQVRQGDHLHLCQLAHAGLLRLVQFHEAVLPRRVALRHLRRALAGIRHERDRTALCRHHAHPRRSTYRTERESRGGPHADQRNPHPCKKFDGTY